VCADRWAQFASEATFGLIPAPPTGLDGQDALYACLAGGIPVATTDRPDLTEVVYGHDAGHTFDPADSTDLLQGIMAVLDERDRLAVGAQRAASREELRWASQEAKLLEHYATL
jgi:glycosyltransferase involved in cell wall biosynthesis